MIQALRYRWTELVLIAVLTVFAAQLHPGWWAPVAFVACAVGRQEWRTWRIPAEQASVPEDPDNSADQERAARG